MIISLRLLLTFICSSFVNQIDWSDGPGIPGPSQYWYSAFHTENSIYWERESSISLAANCTKRTVDPANSHFLRTGDINSDGLTDIVASNGSAGEHIWFENTSSGSSWTKHVIDAPGTGCPFSFPFDADGDGDLDVFGASMHATGNLICYHNENGSGLAWNAVEIGTTTDCWAAAEADMDNDGDPDVVTASSDLDVGMSWWENTTGSGNQWTEHMISDQLGFYLLDFQIQDMDSDGDPDIIAAGKYNYILLMENVGSATSPAWQKHVIGTGAPVNLFSTSVAAGDLDGDGDMDIAVTDDDHDMGTGWYQGRIFWFENDGSSWGIHVLNDSLPGLVSVKIVDMTSDGYNDILASGAFADTYVYLWINPGYPEDSWTRIEIDEGNTYWDVLAEDIDGDGTEDVLTSGDNLFWSSVHTAEYGNLTSTIRDLTCYPVWHTIGWEGFEGTGTDLYFQVRGSNDPDDLGEWSEMIYEPGTVAGFTDSTYRYIQYRAHLENSNKVGTPVLEKVSLFCSGTGGIEEGGTSGVTLLPLPSPSALGTVSFQVTEPADAGISVHDLSGRSVFTVSDHWQTGTHNVQLPSLPAGVYVIRLESGDWIETARAVKL